MPFRDRFECLWCGSAHEARSQDDIEGWAQLCPACVGRAGDNEFLRFRLRQALTERGAARPASPAAGEDPAARGGAEPSQGARDVEDWYQRRGRFSRGPIHDAAWHAELDAAGRWLDGLPIGGEIVELAAGPGWWSPLLAGKGELTLHDELPAALDRARERLVAHRLRAHLHVRDRWAEPDREVDVLFSAFLLGRLPADRLSAFGGLARRWLRPDGHLAFIERIPDPAGVPEDHPLPPLTAPGGPPGRVPWHEPSRITAALRDAGFTRVDTATTGRFLLLGWATAGGAEPTSPPADPRAAPADR